MTMSPWANRRACAAPELAGVGGAVPARALGDTVGKQRELSAADAAAGHDGEGEHLAAAGAELE